MDTEPIFKTLFDYGPIGIMFVLVMTGFLVPKPFYERESKRADVATDAAEKNADALKTVTESNKVLADEIKGLRADLRAK